MYLSFNFNFKDCGVEVLGFGWKKSRNDFVFGLEFMFSLGERALDLL